jgi:tetrahydromethanopterin S-methyltransferase subunit A
MAAEHRRERPRAVSLMRRLDALRGLAFGHPIRRALRRLAGRPDWPVTTGAYLVGDPTAPVAVCTLTDRQLMQAAADMPGVAIAGRVYTANLGIEKIVLNVISNPRIRFLLLCGRDSPLFQPGQTLISLWARGIDAEHRIIGADGYLPVLSTLPSTQIEQFRRQVEVVDCIGQAAVASLAERTRSLAERSPGPFAEGREPARAGVRTPVPDHFVQLRPGGRREPLTYDPTGYFVITLDRSGGQVVVRHYRPDNTPAHEMRGRHAESVLLGLLREGLVSELSHAGYLGSELAKAEAALRLGLLYEQDQPLRHQPG